MRLSLIAILLLTGCAHLQRTPEGEFKSFEYGFKTSMSVKDQYEKSLFWMANTYKNIGAVISYSNAGLGAIRGHSRVCISYATSPHSLCTTYNLDIDCKDGYVKLTFHNLEGLAHMDNGFYVKGLDVSYWEQYKMAKKHFNDLALKWMGTL